ncbi:HSE1 [Candida pseudojiufengensis]|uniref:HSE1 n=1 Tax=Candida pseudojiufengensis TaxID=497109 RepID=UPI0022243053|nr:HSE1 [Candida pseudojiufengensis]KAI5963636.1 HSE1 [Candida pseudojiufengensis]
MAPLDTIINKATDPTLTSDNWQYILDVCDKISSDPELETTRAINLIKSKISSTKDANTILRSLSLITAIAENCGSRMKQEIATKSFLQDCFIKKLQDKKLHVTVKYRIIEVLEQLNKSFESDPSLKPINDAYNKAKNEYPQYFKNQHGPSKPAKQERTQQDKNKEDEELQRVLKLSLQEYEDEQNLKKQYLNNKPLPDAENSNIQPIPPSSPESSNETQTVATVSKVKALYDLISYEEDELSFRKGDVITVIESVYRDWWRGSLPNGKIGIFPLNYVTPIVNKTPQELAKEAEIEDHLLNIDQRKIERLLAILSTNDISQVDEDEVTELYNSVISSRIQLGNSIDKYSVRQEELTVLNNQLTTEAKSYNQLLEKSINNRTKFNSPNNNHALPYPAVSQSIPQLIHHPTQPQQNAPQQSPQQHYQQQRTSYGGPYTQPIYNEPPYDSSPNQPQYNRSEHVQGQFNQNRQPSSSHNDQTQYTGQQSQPTQPHHTQSQQNQSQPTHQEFLPTQFTQPQFKPDINQAQYPQPSYAQYQQRIQEQNTSAGFGNGSY